MCVAQASHTVNMPHTCNHHTTHMQATPGPARIKRKRRRGDLWAMPSHLALILPTPPPITLLGLGPAYTLTWCHCGRHSGQGGRGCLCWKGRGDQQPSPLGPGTWDLGAAGLGQAHPTIPSPEDLLKNEEAGPPAIFRPGPGDANRANLTFGYIK